MPATGSQALITACTPTQREGTADHSPDNPISCCSTISDSSFINSDKSCSLSPCLSKSFPKYQKFQFFCFSEFLFQILVAGILLSYGERQFQMKEAISGVSFSLTRPSSTGHTPTAACWHSPSFKYAFISHTRLSTQQTILHYNPASHSPDCCCPFQKYLRSQASLCYQV